MNHRGTVTIETKRLILRRFEIADAEAMYENWANDPQVTKYLTWQPHKSVADSRAVLESWIPLYEKLDQYNWAIVLKEIGQPIGSISVVKLVDAIRAVQFGYCIGQKWWHRGIMSEALAELIRFFFEEVGVNRIEAKHDPRNPNSGNVMIKCGLIYEGTHRQTDISNQGICDTKHYAILASDYFKK